MDPRVRATVREVLAAQPPGQPLAAGQLHDQVLARLTAPIRAGELPRPSRAAVRRLAAELLISAEEKRAGRMSDAAVGERVYLDTVELPLPTDETGPEQERLRLLIAVDEVTCLVLTAVVYAGHRPPLHAALLAQMCMPVGMRADWGSLLSGNLRSTGRMDGPSLLVRPDTLVVDGAYATSLRALRDACARLGIQVRYAQRLRPTERLGVERTLRHLASLFTDYLLSPAGQAARAAGWPPEIVQDTLDAWVARVWPGAPVPTAHAGGAHTPRTRHETLTASAG